MIAIQPSPLSREEEHFRKDGYCLVPNLFTPAQIGEMEAFFENYKSRGAPVFDAGSSYEEIDITKRQLRAMHPHRYSEQVLKWFLNPNVAAVLETLLGKAPLGVQTMYYFKPPGARGQGMHQDNFYLLARPATCIAAWTAIDDSTIDNGCLWVVPGSNQDAIVCPSEEKEEKWLSYGDSHITKFPHDKKPVPVEVPRGSTLFFGGNLIHGSGPNRTKDKSRRAFIGHYISEASDEVARFYHPVLNMRGQVISHLGIPAGGGPCGDGWLGATH
jgi:ectoine hydroxylase-related dioxygenase (phytanoyl-CoA dioxygenase family)